MNMKSSISSDKSWYSHYFLWYSILFWMWIVGVIQIWSLCLFFVFNVFFDFFWAWPPFNEKTVNIGPWKRDNREHCQLNTLPWKSNAWPEFLLLLCVQPQPHPLMTSVSSTSLFVCVFYVFKRSREMAWSLLWSNHALRVQLKIEYANGFCSIL